MGSAQPLHMLKPQILEDLSQVEACLKTYQQSPEETEMMVQSVEKLHQIHGTLVMVELPGAALLAEEASHLLEALLKGDVQDPLAAMEGLYNAVLRLPIYLELIEKGQEDRPIMLLPMINDCRDLRGAVPLPKADFFTPNIETVEHFSRLSETKDYQDAEIELIKKLRKIYLVGLLGVMREENFERSLKYIQQVLTDLDGLSGAKPLGQFWWIARAVVHGLQQGEIQMDVTLKLLLGRVDREIKRFIDEGLSALNSTPNEAIRNKMLFYIDQCHFKDPLIHEIKVAFGMDEHSQAAEQSNPNLGLDPVVMKQAAHALQQELTQAKEILDSFSRKENAPIAALEPVKQTLNKALQSMRMLGLESQYQVFKEKITILDMILSEEVPPKDNYLLEVASCIIYVETALSNAYELLNNDRYTTEESAFAMYEQNVALEHVKEAEMSILKEARVEISKIKEGVEAYVKEGKVDALKPLQGLFEGICANLNVLSIERPIKLLKGCSVFINEKLISGEGVEPILLDHLAEIISSIEYYLESKENDTPMDSVLERAEHQLGAMGVA